MKHIVIRHDGNGNIAGKGITIEEINPNDEDYFAGDDEFVCSIPVRVFPKKIIKELVAQRLS